MGEIAGNFDNSHPKESLQFLYPYGVTLNVESPAIAILSTGTVAFPLNRPICAIAEIEVGIILYVMPYYNLKNRIYAFCHINK